MFVFSPFLLSRAPSPPLPPVTEPVPTDSASRLLCLPRCVLLLPSCPHSPAPGRLPVCYSLFLSLVRQCSAPLPMPRFLVASRITGTPEGFHSDGAGASTEADTVACNADLRSGLSRPWPGRPGPATSCSQEEQAGMSYFRQKK